MATTVLGRVVPLHKGEYKADAQYELNHIVRYNGSTWWHWGKDATIGVTPAQGDVWTIVMDVSTNKGDPGEKGDPGHTPEKGVDYFTDEDIKAIVLSATNEVNKTTIKKYVYNAVLTADWTGAGPYTQTVSIGGIKATDTPHVGPVYDDDAADTAKAQAEAWQCVSYAKAADGKILFTCLDTKPTVDIPIQVEVIS